MKKYYSCKNYSCRNYDANKQQNCELLANNNFTCKGFICNESITINESKDHGKEI